VVATLIPGWWVAAICSLILTVYLIGASGNFWDFFQGDTGEPMSVSANFGTGNTPWGNISRALTAPELHGMASLRAFPLLAALLISAVCCVVTVMLYERKQLK